MRLTIAIPTYNRVAKLRFQLQSLIPQLTADDSIVVLDNASPGFCEAELPELRHEQVSVDRNFFNLGGNANAARCLTVAPDGWIWVLCDDDPVLPDAISTIRQLMARYPECGFINFFDSNLSRVPRPPGGKLCRDLQEFIESNDGFSNTLLASNSVFNITALSPYIKYTYTAINFNCPHLGAAIVALQHGVPMHYASHQIVSWNAPDPHAKDHWNSLLLYRVLEAKLLVERQDLAEKFEKILVSGLPSLSRFVVEYCDARIGFGPDWRATPYARTVVRAMTRHSRGGLVLYALALFSLRFPRLTLGVCSMVYRRLRGRPLSELLQGRQFQPFL